MPACSPRTLAVLLPALGLLFAAHAFAASAPNTLDLEGAWVFPGYNDVAIPGDTGTRLSLTEDLDADAFAAFRARYARTFGGRHWFGLLAAPLTMKSEGVLAEDTAFNGTDFAAGTPVKSTFRFDSYRLSYRYLFPSSGKWRFGLGLAVQVRDAAIRLEGGGTASEKTNTGGVPLLSFSAAYAVSGRVDLVVDGEALAAPQGRAEDVLFALHYRLSDAVALKAGYRILEGGSDSDEVYTFSLFNYATVGAVISF